jgi:hypothetical protein
MPHKLRRTALLMLTVPALMLLAASPAIAQPPANDDFDSATVVPGLPFTDQLNTTEATTATDDPECDGQGPTVWYSFTPAADVRVEANTFGSDYDTTLSAYTGARGALTQIACNDDAAGSLQSRVRFDATAGQTFFFMVGSFGSGPGGNLTFSVDVAPPALELGLTIDPTGSVVPSKGVATISGTVTCSQPASVGVEGRMEQRVGRLLIHGFFFAFVECTSPATAWSATVEGENGLFVAGRAQVDAFAFAFDEDVFAEASATVRLRGSGP